MSNKYVTDIVELITRPLDDLECGGCDLVEISIKVTRKEISGSIRKGVKCQDQQKKKKDNKE